MDLSLTCGGRVSSLLTAIDELTNGSSRELLLPRNTRHLGSWSSRCDIATLTLGFELLR